jgi:hypothetical protein
MNEFDELERRQVWWTRLKKEFNDYENHHDSHRFLSSVAQMLTLRDKKIYDMVIVIKNLLDK